jgi:hypothetical protein
MGDGLRKGQYAPLAVSRLQEVCGRQSASRWDRHRDVAKRITGHETDAMWRRYSIVKEDDIERALDATPAYIGQQVTTRLERKVLALPDARG